MMAGMRTMLKPEVLKDHLLMRSNANRIGDAYRFYRDNMKLKALGLGERGTRTIKNKVLPIDFRVNHTLDT